MKRILSEVLRRKNGVEQRNGRAGALPIEFIERSRNESSLGIEWLFAAYGAECSGRNWQVGSWVEGFQIENGGRRGVVRRTLGSVRARP